MSVDSAQPAPLDPEPEQWPGPRRRLSSPLIIAVAVVLAISVALIAWRQHHAAAGSPDNQMTAAGYSTALLARLPRPAGAQRVAQPPIPELSESPVRGGGILDARVAWWTVPGSRADRVADFDRAPLPAHWNISASSTGGAGPGSSGWVIEVRDPRARFVSSLTVAIAAHGQTVGMLALVDTYAAPVRTPAQVIPDSVDSATFTFAGGGGRSYSSQLSLTFSGPRVTALTRRVNSTPTYVLLTVISCPGARGNVTVTFHSGSRRWALAVGPGTALCSVPSLTGTSGSAIDLSPSTALLTDVLAAAGLPSDYLDR